VILLVERQARISCLAESVMRESFSPQCHFEMAELSALYEECSDLPMDGMPSEGDLPQMEAGIGSREPSLNPSRSRARHS
jgi:hypothetical protein